MSTPLRSLLIWATVFAALGMIAVQMHPHTDLRALVPAGDAELERSIAFFEGRAAAHYLVLEARADDQDTAVAVLNVAAAELRERGLHLVAEQNTAGLAVVEQVHAHLAPLFPLEAYANLEQRISVPALTSRIRSMREFLLKPGNEFYANALWRDVLALGGDVLGSEQSGSFAQGIRRHDDGHSAMALLRVPFAPSDAEQTATLMTDCDELAAAASHHGVRLETIGSYRHFRDNYRQIWTDLGTTLPISLIAILGLLVLLFRRLRAIMLLHLPALTAIVAGCAALVIIGGGSVPIVVLGFGAGMLGIAVDYGIHMTRACQRGDAPSVRRPLIVGFATAATAFSVLLLARTEALQALAVFTVCGLAAALIVTLWLLPRTVRANSARDPWAGIGERLVDWCAAHRGLCTGLTILLTIALAPGLRSLALVDDPRKLDGSSPETIAALDAFRERWELPAGHHFLVAESSNLHNALATITSARADLGLPPDPLLRWLPPTPTQQTRITMWQAWWAFNGERFEQNLNAACAELGLRAEAFAPSIAHYQRSEWPIVTLDTWQDTPVREQLAAVITATDDGWQVLTEPGRDDDETFAAISDWVNSNSESGLWFASRRTLGAELVTVMAAELDRITGVIGIAMLVMLIILLRRPRMILAVAIPPGFALLWTFGAFGYLGMELSALHLIVAAFIAGIGIDDAVFLSDPTHRRQTVSAVLATTATSLAGVGAMTFAGHPMVSAVGAAIFIGMAACLLSCLLCFPLLAPRGEPAQS